MMPLRILTLLLLLLLGFRASAAPLPALSVVPGTGTVLAGPNAAYWQFAPRSASDETPLEHTFLLRNDSKTALTVKRVAVSCDCVEAQIGEAQSLPVQIAPGQTISVAVRLLLRRLVPGPVSKSAWVYLHGAGENGLQLELRGTVHDDPSASH